MDGRLFPRWLVVGGLVAGAVGCKSTGPGGLPAPAPSLVR